MDWMPSTGGNCHRLNEYIIVHFPHTLRYEIDQSQTIFSVRHEIDQLQLNLNVNKTILLIVIRTDSWHQNIAFWLMF